MCWLIAGGDRLGDVADDGVGAVAAGVQVGIVDADRPAGAAVGGWPPSTGAYQCRAARPASIAGQPDHAAR